MSANPQLHDELDFRRRLYARAARWSIITSILDLFGCAAIAAGVFVVSVPAGLIVSGVVFLFLSFTLGPETDDAE